MARSALPLPLRIAAAPPGAAAVWLGGMGTVPRVPAPMTLQTLGLILAGGLFGVRAGGLAGVLFLAAVLAGAPILSGGASAPAAAFMELGTGGFVVAFILGGALAGLADGALSFAGLLPGAVAKSAVAALILRPFLASRRPA